MTDREFFSVQSEQNYVKSTIVSKYFKPWCEIVSGWSKDRIAYVDLFAGPGRFDDGSPSTPLLVLQQAIENEKIGSKLLAVFNDSSLSKIERLSSEIDALPGVDRLRYRPRLTNVTIGSDLAEVYSNLSLVPSLFFIDPFGYKGLSLKLIGNVISSWGCECIFFFNFNEINRAISIEMVSQLIEDIFGAERAREMRKLFESERVTGPDRERLVIEELISALKEVGGRYVLPFRFESQHAERTSHYIMFVSKHPRGYFIMKEVMYALSSDDGNVKKFEWVPIKTKQLELVLDFDDPYGLSALQKLLLKECAGQTLSVKQVYEGYTIDTPYVLKNVKDAISALERDGDVSVDIPAPKRRKHKGEVTLGKDRLVTFSRM